MQCTNCNHQVEDIEALYCAQCGVALSSEGRCRTCGKKLHPNANFCDRCGTPVETLAVASVPEVAEPSPMAPSGDAANDAEPKSEIKQVIEEEVKRRVAEARAEQAILEEKNRQSKLTKYGFKERDWVVISGGRYIMGSPEDEVNRFDNERQHEVQIARFELMKTPVTFEMFDLFCDETKHPRAVDEGWGREDRPVINVTYWSAVEYCIWLSKRIKRTVRLPTEAEWEFACRAGTTTPFWTGETISTEQANFDGRYSYGGSAKGSSRGQTTPVKMFAPNPWGLRDMHGNVWEWCGSIYDENYEGLELEDAGRNQGDLRERIVRGGSWYNVPSGIRSAIRNKLAPNYHYLRVGFRVAREME
jgi:formylglycine-generating enzyme required for sulfatase activity